MDCRCVRTFNTDAFDCFSNSDVVVAGSIWELVPYTIAGGEIRLERFFEDHLEYVEITKQSFSAYFSGSDAVEELCENDAEANAVKETVNGFCPILREPCRKDCAWGHAILEIDEDGYHEDVVCAIAYVGAWCMLDIQGDPNDVYFDEGDE